MTHHKIHEEHRTLDRAELADRLRRVADELDSGSVITYGGDGTTGTLALPDKLHGELEITSAKHDGHIKLVARLHFTEPKSENATRAEALDRTDTDETDADEWEADDPYA
ncbi:amphi-Trp domain-containing protein [Nocardia aurantiaca]|uniref:Amphi-Trp domain-containing protein n=1 Tax=Nocardia aurantiaca TaxID=2675850 RepID=A0A6I3KXB1_9NOCA|nr:amphi-Trp domain-containing protein [Nocardia aurantiaca]MTE14317.1 hypothetical protein [Nocardia aurantiaca]